ncbi:Fe-S-containing protein [Otariodibacter sp.]|uniref:Fe-S-containing protein n=1 Tax=Otariodibacter sp. TaxID=3030919 RepID=UPI002601D717|nr:Fe-S-containing protein [Otariodibacter sp.]
MNYFFVFLLQSVMPFALLLGCMWSNYSKVKIQSLIWSSIFAIFIGIAIYLNLPQNQTTVLVLTGAIASLLFIFYLVQFFYSKRLAYILNFILCLVAGIIWAKDPNITSVTNTDVINTDFILNICAIVLGFLFCLFIACWINILLKQKELQQKFRFIRLFVITAVTLLLLIPMLSDILLSLMKLQILDLTKLRLTIVAKSGSLTNYFNYINMVVLILVLLVFIPIVYIPRKKSSISENDLIEKRQKTAIFLVAKRLFISGFAIICIIFSTQLYWDQVASQAPRLSEATPVTLDENNQVRIPIETVKDGKLHRFVWIADDGKAVRFFIINRVQGKVSLGVVFDACLLCGDQGYIMEGDQVICVGCGVRVFIPSIGKPGGCNPVPIDDWEQTEDSVVISKASLEAGKTYFSTVVELEVTDPVDHSKVINTKTEYRYTYNDKTYFFATEENMSLFRDNPEKYVQDDATKGE